MKAFVLALLLLGTTVHAQVNCPAGGVFFGFTCVSPESREEIQPGGFAICIGAIGNCLPTGEPLVFDGTDTTCFYGAESDHFTEDPISQGSVTIQYGEQVPKITVIQARAEAAGILPCSVHTFGHITEPVALPFDGEWGIALTVTAGLQARGLSAPRRTRAILRAAHVRVPPLCSRKIRKAARAQGMELFSRLTPSGKFKSCRVR